MWSHQLCRVWKVARAAVPVNISCGSTAVGPEKLGIAAKLGAYAVHTDWQSLSKSSSHSCWQGMQICMSWGSFFSTHPPPYLISWGIYCQIPLLIVWFSTCSKSCEEQNVISGGTSLGCVSPSIPPKTTCLLHLFVPGEIRRTFQASTSQGWHRNCALDVYPEQPQSPGLLDVPLSSHLYAQCVPFTCSAFHPLWMPRIL